MTTTQGRPPFRRRQLGRMLRRLREQAGITQEEAATRLRYSDSKISRFESGQLPDYHALKAMLDLYGLIVNDWEPVLDLWELAKQKGWWHAYGLADQGYVSMEDEAESVRIFQSGVIPGLLQTERYARALFECSTQPHPAKWVDNQVAVRMRRQQRLTADPPLCLDAVIEESALSRSAAPEIVRAQLHRIVERTELPNVGIRVLPSEAGLHDGVSGPFSVLGFPDPEDGDIGYAEHAFGSVHLEDREQVAAATLTFGHLADLALGEQDSRARIERLAAEL